MLTIATLLAGYPVFLGVTVAIDRALGWPLADALGHPHP